MDDHTYNWADLRKDDEYRIRVRKVFGFWRAVMIGTKMSDYPGGRYASWSGDRSEAIRRTAVKADRRNSRRGEVMRVRRG